VSYELQLPHLENSCRLFNLYLSERHVFLSLRHGDVEHRFAKAGRRVPESRRPMEVAQAVSDAQKTSAHTSILSRGAALGGPFGSSNKEAQIVTERWRVHYNTVRPHSSLGYRPPASETIAPQLHNPVPALANATYLRG
jgi:transposase InsO family protein